MSHILGVMCDDIRFDRNQLDAAIRRVPGFPKPGITFYDITSVVAHPRAFRYCIQELSRLARESGAQSLAAIEARGFVFASAMAYELGLPLMLVRKKGKLPNICRSASYDLEYGSDTVCIQELDLKAGQKVFVVDDLIATGGTLGAAIRIMRDSGMVVSGIGAVIGLPFLGFQAALAPCPVHTLVDFHAE